MKKVYKILLLILVFFAVLILGFTFFALSITKNIKLDENKIINMQRTIIYYDCQNKIIDEQSEGVSVTEFDNIPNFTKKAFIAIEDKRFYKHKGVDKRGLFRAIVNNIKSLSLKEGASTITQQLIKNTHFSSEKTLKRKLSEMKLAKLLEKKYSKDQILEKYLNTIYFGEGCYGITSASEHYFGISPDKLNINQSAFLAGIIKAPSTYLAQENNDKCLNRKNTVLREMYEQGYISKDEYDDNSSNLPELSKEQPSSSYDYLYLVKQQLNVIFDNDAYSTNKFKVYTYYDKDIQQNLQESINSIETDTDKATVIFDKNNKIKGYFSTCGEICRQMGSTIKPILVYAPAIENNIVDSCTIINDEQISFNGYSPSNYNDKYYGNVSVKFSLAKSLNTCSVKLLNYVGIEHSKDYLRKMKINLTENDNSLCLALGSTEKGAKLAEIASAYNVFQNNGIYNDKSCINKIVTDSGKVIYMDNTNKTPVFEDGTVSIINDMLNYATKEGTAKKLGQLPFSLYAKTGTVGTKNGNTDAYCISYNKDYIVGTWIGNYDNSLMKNNITGGTIPTNISYKIWDKLYKNKKAPEKIQNSSEIEEIELDKISYEKENIIVRASENTPERYIKRELFRKSHIPNEYSTRFTSPTIEKPILTVNNNGILIQLCLTEYYDALLYKESDGIKTLIYDTNEKDKSKYFDKFDDNLSAKTYIYTIIPYFKSNNGIIYGEELLIDKIKAPENNLEGDWWLNNEL